MQVTPTPRRVAALRGGWQPSTGLGGILGLDWVAALHRIGWQESSEYAIPQAYVYPAQMRATRDLLRRRTHLMRTRAELLAHVQHTNSQDNLPAIGKKIAYKTNRAGVY